MKRTMRGQFYSVIAVIIVVSMLVFVSTYLTKQPKGTDVYERVVSDQIRQVGGSVEKDLARALQISGRRALIAAADQAILNGTALDDADLRVEELMQNGTIYGQESLFMLNNTMGNWTSRILAVRTNFNVELRYSEPDVSDLNATDVNATSFMSLKVYERSGFAILEKSMERKEAIITVEGIGDPLFPLRTNGLVTRSVRLSPYPYRGAKVVEGGLNSSGSCSGNVTFNPDDASSSKILVVKNISGIPWGQLSAFAGVVSERSENLTGIGLNCYVTGNSTAVQLVNASTAYSGYYEVYIDEETGDVWSLPVNEELWSGLYHSGSGPNILKRMENSLPGSPNGLTSFVNLLDLESQGIPVKENQVSLDYLYFSGQDIIGYRVRGLPSWFRLNSTHAQWYGIGELLEV